MSSYHGVDTHSPGSITTLHFSSSCGSSLISACRSFKICTHPRSAAIEVRATNKMLHGVVVLIFIWVFLVLGFQMQIIMFYLSYSIFSFWMGNLPEVRRAIQQDGKFIAQVVTDLYVHNNRASNHESFCDFEHVYSVQPTVFIRQLRFMCQSL